MKWAAISFGLFVATAASGCWRPYYGYNYAQPAYPQAATYQQPAQVYAQPAPVYQQPQVYQQPVYQQPQIIQQPCCQPNPCCTPY
jgi:hypothetical protein